MSAPLEPGRDALRLEAFNRIDQGRLPARKPARVWGGRGTGERCSLCDQVIDDTSTEMELEYEGPDAPVIRFHIQCQLAWDEACRIRESSWTLVASVLPPLLNTVEARVAMTGSCTIILNVMRANHGDTGPLVWLNANTNSPLPENWRPVEWRPIVAKMAAMADASGACTVHRA